MKRAPFTYQVHIFYIWPWLAQFKILHIQACTKNNKTKYDKHKRKVVIVIFIELISVLVSVPQEENRPEGVATKMIFV